MQSFDVDNANELLPGATRRSDEGGWPKQQTDRHTRQSLWLIAVTVLALAGVVIASIAAVTAEAAARRISAAALSGGSSAGSETTPAAGWGHIKRLAYSSCTSYDVRPQPIWTKVR